MARPIRYLTLHAMPIALLESWRKGKLKILTKVVHARKSYFDLLHCEVLTERKHLSIPISQSFFLEIEVLILPMDGHKFFVATDNFVMHQDHEIVINFHSFHLLSS